jgi:hypothetical protein
MLVDFPAMASSLCLSAYRFGVIQHPEDNLLREYVLVDREMCAPALAGFLLSLGNNVACFGADASTT